VQLFWPRRLLRAAPVMRGVAAGFDAAVVGSIWWVSTRLGPERSNRLFRWTFRWLGPLHSKHDKVVENLVIAFPEKRAREIKLLARQVWEETGALVSEYANMPRIAAEAERRVEFVVHGELAVLREGHRPAVFVSAHYGAWEFALLLASHFGVPLTAMYNFDYLHSNPRVAQRVEASRTSLPADLIPRQRGIRPLVRALSAGRSVGLVVDFRFDQCELIPFFQRGAYTTTLPARLALRYGCELIPVRVDRTDAGRYRLSLYGPVAPDDPTADAREQARQMTRKVNEHFESWIRERPGQWLCLKRRWPKGEARAPQFPMAVTRIA